MPKPKIPNSRKSYLEHRKRIERYVALINQLYDRFNKEAAKLALSTGHDPAAQFLWSDYPETARALKKLQEQYVSEMKGIIMAGTSSEWKESDLVQDLVAKKLLKAYTGTTKAGEEYQRYFQTDPDALKAFQQRTTEGMNLSRRVWNLSEQYKTELEMAVSAAIEPGTSAMELASGIKKYLNEPHMMFRRFRYKDENGEWRRKWKQKVTDADGKVRFIDSDPKAYHPGRGVYRSSARNAQRLARTEINMAYRTAEQERWGNFDFVVGYEVKITQNGKHVEDICDCLKGKYRKDFKFMGWHPQCMCYTIPILKTEDEFFDDDDDAKSVNKVEDVPQGFKDWVADNKERIEAAEKRGTLPYFIRDNRGAVDAVLKPEEVETVKPKAEPKADAPKAKAEDDAIAKALGIERGKPMTFEEANEMRGNPNYKEDVQYRVNCQSCVVANEMRRRGYDVEAFGNTWAVNHTPNALSRKTEAAWLDADGSIPQINVISRKVTLGEKTIDRRGNVRVKKTKESDRELSGRIMEAMSEEGRYTIAWKWSNKHNGHIITAERLADGSLRFYDPQTGIIGWTAKFKDIDTEKGFKILRVDNLKPNIDVLRGVVKPSGSNAAIPLMNDAQKAFWKKLGMGSDVVQGDYKPEYKPLTSPEVAKLLKEARKKEEKLNFMDKLLSDIDTDIQKGTNKDVRDKMIHVDNNGSKTLVHPGHKTKDKYWDKTFDMAKGLNRNGRNVAFLPESENNINGDAITIFKGMPHIADFKYCASTKSNTLQAHLAEGFRQADVVVLKLDKMDAGQFRETIEYLKRKDLPLNNIILMNKYDDIVELSRTELHTMKYRQKIKGFLK